MSEQVPAHAVTDADVRSAFQRWARTVFAAPRQAHDLIVGVEERDEVVERLVTQVARREVREVRVATRERRSTVSPVSATEVDPFAHTVETLRVQSQHVAHCAGCGASGMEQCAQCRGDCTVRCWTCSGSGKQRSEKTGRPINCKTCKKSGRMPCGSCDATGKVACKVCAGSGHQLAWLTFEERESWHVSLSPEGTPIVLAYPALCHSRPLSAEELAAFSVAEEKRSQGPLSARDLGPPYRRLPETQSAVIDPRLERIRSQQYLRLAILRRDVMYEMCGTRGTAVLSGKTLLGATTPEAIRPIRRRLYLWLALVALIAVIGVFVRAAFVGSSSYFDGARLASGLLVAGVVGCAVPVIGTILRAWQGGARFRGTSRTVTVLASGMGVALAGVMVVGLVARPSTDEVQEALAAGDVARAHTVLAALREQSPGEGTEAVADRVALAEAAQQRGTARLRLLDAVARRGGAAAQEAAAAARADRLAEIRTAIQAKNVKAALATLDGAFSGDKADDIAEERARAHEVTLSQCELDACRFAAAARANGARTSPERTAQADALRTRALEALAPEKIDAKAPTLARLQQLRKLSEVGAQTLELAPSDAAVVAKANAAIAFAAVERAKVPLLRAEQAVVEELLGGAGASQTGVPRIDLDGLHAHFAFDAAKKCTGIYAVGTASANRVFKSEAWPADRLLSQAFGKTVKLKEPAEVTATVQTYESGYAVVARWRGSEVVELRVGNATP